jgi:hypothetical protein
MLLFSFIISGISDGNQRKKGRSGATGGSDRLKRDIQKVLYDSFVRQAKIGASELKIFLSILLVFVIIGACAAGEPSVLDRQGAKRYKALVRIVDKNTGFAHMTRGMNVNTINALKNAVTQSDIPVLKKMLENSDRIVIMTSVNVLMEMGHEGRDAVYDVYGVTSNKDTLVIISDQLDDLVLDKKSQITDWKEDIPSLRRMAGNDNYRVAYTAVKLLAAMGKEGNQILEEIYYGTTNQKTKAIVKE